MALKKAVKSVKTEKPKSSKNEVLKEVEIGKYTVRIENYKGRPSCGIHLTSRIEAGEDFTLFVGFGIAKAKAIAECIEEITDFVEQYGDSNGD
jgi:hypothetical protein